MDILVVVDMQNDFVSMALGTAEAQKIAPKAAERIDTFKGKVIFTRDTHDSNYMDTQEGRRLPVPHCIYGSEGWQLEAGIENSRKRAAKEGRELAAPIDKPTFGSTVLAQTLEEYARTEKIDSITLVGLCTDICVISNALLLKAYMPEVPIIVDAGCCAGVTPQSHDNALAAMEKCQIEVIRQS